MSAESCTFELYSVLVFLVILVFLVFLEYYVALGFYLYCLINLLVFLLALRPPENLVLSNMSKIVATFRCDSGE